jgi:hypothetical protein
MASALDGEERGVIEANVSGGRAEQGEAGDEEEEEEEEGAQDEEAREEDGEMGSLYSSLRVLRMAFLTLPMYRKLMPVRWSVLRM